MIPVKGLEHIGMITADWEKSFAFYQTLGFTKGRGSVRERDGKQIVFQYMNHGNCAIELIQSGAKPVPGTLHFCFEVEDIHAIYQHLLALNMYIEAKGGITVPQWDDTLRTLFTQGPDGERLEFVQRT